MSNVDPEATGTSMRRAAEAGHIEAMFQLADLHLQGYGVKKSDAAAMRWFGQAAAKGHAAAALKLRDMLDAGLGDPTTHAALRQQLAVTPKPAPAAAAARPAPAPVAKSTPAPRPVSVATSAKPPTPMPASATAPARPATQLSEVTRHATTWAEFFAASARRTAVSHRQHDPDVKLFLEKHPATAGQLRDAYRRARDAYRPTPGTVRGREFGAQFVTYHLAILATGLSEQAAAEFVRDDFQTLTRADVHSAQQALMGVAKVPPFRPFLTPQQNQQIRDLADLVIRRQPLHTVPKPYTSAAATKPAKPVPKPDGPANPEDASDVQGVLAELVEAAIHAVDAKDWVKAANNITTALFLADKHGTAQQIKLIKETRQLLREEIFSEAQARFRAGDSDLMLARLEQAAGLGHPAAHYMLGLAYAEGEGVAPDLGTARKWLQQAAELGHKDAANALTETRFAIEPGAAEFAQGDALRQSGDHAGALPLLKQAATQGHTQAAYAVGEAYLDGKGVARDLALASDWIELCQENHRKNPNNRNKLMAENAQTVFIGAKLQAGMINAGGTQVEEALAHVDANNYPAAAAAFRTAAALGNVNGMRSLGILYMNGQGVKLDFDESRKWLRRALAFDHPQANADLRALESKVKLFKPR